jgi:hypothetical protein
LDGCRGRRRLRTLQLHLRKKLRFVDSQFYWMREIPRQKTVHSCHYLARPCPCSSISFTSIPFSYPFALCSPFGSIGVSLLSLAPSCNLSQSSLLCNCSHSSCSFLTVVKLNPLTPALILFCGWLPMVKKLLIGSGVLLLLLGPELLPLLLVW